MSTSVFGVDCKTGILVWGTNSKHRADPVRVEKAFSAIIARKSLIRKRPSCSPNPDRNSNVTGNGANGLHDEAPEPQQTLRQVQTKQWRLGWYWCWHSCLREAFLRDRFLPGVPHEQIEEIYNAAPGNEIASGKFGSPESSAALAANTFGFFLNRPGGLPPLPGCDDVEWPASSLTLEKEVRFPWRARWGHPILDILTATPSALIGIESKRFEAFQDNPEANFTDTYWRKGWGDSMGGYQRVRDTLHENGSLYRSLKADQLVKHALGLRTQTRPGKEYAGLSPILFYLYAEPDFLPNSNKPIDDEAKAAHRDEIKHFARSVEGDEVRFVACTYRVLLATWDRSENPEIREHTKAVVCRFSP